MARTVQIELDVQDAKAVAAWQRSRDSIAQFNQQLDGTDQKNKKNQSSASGFFGEVKRGIGATAAAITGVTGVVGGMLAVVQQLRAEYDNIVERQRNAADATKTFEQSLAQAVRNATGIFTAQETRQISLDLARSAGIDPSRAASLVGSSLTSTGVQNAGDARLAIAAAGAAARYAPGDELTTQESLAGVAAGIAKKSGISPEAAIGFMSRVGQQANVRALPQQVKNIAPGIPALAQFGFSEGEAGSLLATISQQTFDEEGAISLTASLAFAESLRERFRDDRRFQNADGGFDPIAAITAIQQSPELRKRFLEGGTFSGKKFSAATLGRGRAKPAFEALLTRGSKVSRQFAGGIDAIGSFSDGEESYASMVDQLAAATLVSRAQRAIEAGRARLNVTDPEAIAGVLRDELPKLQQAAGSSALQQKLTSLGLEFEGRFGTDQRGALGYAVSTLESEAQNLRNGNLVEVSSGIGDIYGVSQPEYTRVPATAREKQTASEIDVVVTELRNLIRVLENPQPVAVNVQQNSAPAQPAVRAAELGGR